MITIKQIENAQNKWGNGIVKIGSLMKKFKLCKDYTSEFLNDTYNFKEGKVLFKPTKAKQIQFRPTYEMALSYFLGGENSFCSEDKGFALKPWIKVSFENHDFILEKNRAIVMGNYYFTDKENNIVKVEYTFGYKLINSKLFINLHHSSLPYSG